MLTATPEEGGVWIETLNLRSVLLVIHLSLRGAWHCVCACLLLLYVWVHVFIFVWQPNYPHKALKVLLEICSCTWWMQWTEFGLHADETLHHLNVLVESDCFIFFLSKKKEKEKKKSTLHVNWKQTRFKKTCTFCQIQSHLITLSIIELVEKKMVIGMVCLHISLGVKSTRESTQNILRCKEKSSL